MDSSDIINFATSLCTIAAVQLADSKKHSLIVSLLLYCWYNSFASSALNTSKVIFFATSLISSSIQGTGKLLTNSSINGVVNAFFMLRTGMLARNYLYAKDPKKDKLSIKNSAFVFGMDVL